MPTSAFDVHEPQHVRRRRGEVPFHQVRRADRCRVGPGGLELPAADGALQAGAPHQALDLPASDQLASQWDHLHAIYFGGYALWTYATLPFTLTTPGFCTQEIEPWTEQGQTWRRLAVTFPDSIATHSTEQVLYIDDAGLVRRHDYTATVTGGGPAAHYLTGHQDFDGIVFPTLRQVFLRQEDNTPAPEPLLISMEFDGYQLS